MGRPAARHAFTGDSVTGAVGMAHNESPIMAALLALSDGSAMHSIWYERGRRRQG